MRGLVLTGIQDGNTPWRGEFLEAWDPFPVPCHIVPQLAGRLLNFPAVRLSTAANAPNPGST
jgi:hypothetical protein